MWICTGTAEDQLLDGNQRHRQRGQHPVFNLARGAQFHGQRQRHRRDALEHHADGHQSRDHDRREAHSGRTGLDLLADMGKNVGEDEHEQQRVHHRPGHERRQPAPQHLQVAQHQTAKRLGVPEADVIHGDPAR
jgi:hypothetical protein